MDVWAVQRDRYGLALVDWERPERIATIATWSSSDSVHQVPVAGLPYDTDPSGKVASPSVDKARLLAVVDKWFGATAAVEGALSL